MHQYTVTTPRGDVNLTTPHHHSSFKSVEDFLKAHQATISATVSLSGLALSALGLYLSHGRKGPRLK